MSTTLEVLAHDTSTSPPARTLSICLINPRFEPSYWGFEYALPLYPGDKRSTMISGSLSSVAGLCGDHNVVVLDENVEEIDWESLHEYDIVGVTGMTVQKERIHEILLRLRELEMFTVVGGPLVSVDEPFFDGLCDAMFVGEAGNDLAPVPARLCPRQADREPLSAVAADRHDQSPASTI